ncbi:nifU-like protein 1, chloroplastic [Actinidia eriantha]|uniref:nifU-like protein 1, chloroplastic n=1 Tax=Actinidia eriantha TaxID=165200 RepID=UPI00258EBA36|nr:nifU-like protein 1, chloroplastic [Actinidia eriantha]
MSDGRKGRTGPLILVSASNSCGLWGIGNRSIPCPKIPSYQFKSPSFGARFRSVCQTQRWAVKASASGSGSPHPGLYSSKLFDLTSRFVDTVLEDVRPYLIADGGNVDVVSVDDGACGSCPSSTTTMKMGIERVLKEKFGDAVKDIRQVYDDQISETMVEAVNGRQRY